LIIHIGVPFTFLDIIGLVWLWQLNSAGATCEHYHYRH
jgi:hypothetical protein